MLRLRWCRKQKELAMKTDQDHFTPMRAVRLWKDPRPMITQCIPMQIWQFYPMTSHVCFGRYKLRHFVGDIRRRFFKAPEPWSGIRSAGASFKSFGGYCLEKLQQIFRLLRSFPIISKHHPHVTGKCVESVMKTAVVAVSWCSRHEICWQVSFVDGSIYFAKCRFKPPRADSCMMWYGKQTHGLICRWTRMACT